MKTILTIAIFLTCLETIAQAVSDNGKWRPLVNQAGYNSGESKRFVCYGAPDGTAFYILKVNGGDKVFEGEILNHEGWFTAFNPDDEGDYIVEVAGHGRSVPFAIGDHLMERISSKLAYDFFVDVRGNVSLQEYDMTKVYGGGPSRDGGAYGLETVFESLLYASNPALFDRWQDELGEGKVPDLIKLILWHADFAYKYRDYNGAVANRHGSLGYVGEPRMSYDYWNTVDQLAVVCAGYHSFLKPYLAEEKYRAYRKACLELWEKYDREKEVRYWTYSTKWVDSGFQEFNEMGNAFGQSVMRNLFMYVSELNEKDGKPDKFLKWAQESAKDIINNWDFNNPRHMWWIRNAEHITPQALALFLLIAPEKAPIGTREKLAAWAVHMKQKTNNSWKYRVHSEDEWAHASTKELGGAPALGGSMFAVAHILKDEQLRQTGWAQVDFTFGVNPVGAHLSNKSKERVAIGGYWDGVENGWPQAYGHGYGQLALTRGTLDGSPLDHHFPRVTTVKNSSVEQGSTDAIGKDSYSTEGWCISNRGWMATVTFSTLGSHSLRVLDEAGNETAAAKPGQTITIALKAALNQDTKARERGWVLIKGEEGFTKLDVVETDNNSGIFTAKYIVPRTAKEKIIEVSYGYWAFAKTTQIHVQK